MKKKIIIVFFMSFFFTFSYAQEIVDNSVLMKDCTKKVYLVGEIPYQRNNLLAKLELFKFFHRHCKVDVIQEVFPTSWIYFIQKYYKTNNDTIFKEALKYSAIDLEYINFDYQIFKNYYDSLPDEDKFIFKGILFEYANWMPIFAIYDLIYNLPVNDKLNNLKEEVGSLYNIAIAKEPKNGESQTYFKNISIIQAFFRNVQQDMNLNNEIYANYFEENYYWFENIINGAVNYFPYMYQPIEEQIEKQTPYIIESFRQIYINNPNAKIFSQLMNCYVFKADYSKLKPFSKSIAFELNNKLESSFAGEVMSLQLYNKNYRNKLKNNIFTKKEQSFLDSIQLKNEITFVNTSDNKEIFVNNYKLFDYVIIVNY